MLFLSIFLALVTFAISSSAANQASELLRIDALTATSNLIPLVQVAAQSDSPTLSKASKLKDRHVEPILQSLQAIQQGLYLIANVTFGNQILELFVDTGSADTWVVATDFHCLNPLGSSPENQTECRIAKTYTPSSTFNAIPDKNFNIGYLDGEQLTGFLATEEVTIAGLTAHNQTIGVVTEAGWRGDGVTSGLLGLSYPAATHMFNGTDPNADVFNESIAYNPVFTSLWMEGLIDPYFSLLVNRGIKEVGEFAGLLGLGAIPDPKSTCTGCHYDEPLVTTPILLQNNTGTEELRDYMIKVDAIEYESSTVWNLTTNGTLYPLVNATGPLLSNFTSFTAHLDCGTDWLLLPATQANDINMLFDPPGQLNPLTGVFDIECTAAPPYVGFFIGGKWFHVDPLDLIQTTVNGNCISAVQVGLPDEYILGIQFYWNTLVVHDVARQVIWIGSRTYY